MPRLLVEPPGEPARVVDVRNGLTAGRNEAADIPLLDPKVSRQHLRFHMGPDGECSVTDLESSHGTLVNDKPIRSASLQNGDVIQVGGVRIKFIDPEEASVVVTLRDTDPFTAETSPFIRVINDEGRKLRVFYDLAKAIRQPEDISALLGEMLEAILDVLGCDRGVIGLYDPSSAAEFLRRIVRVRGGQAPGNVVISQTLIDATLLRRQAIIACDVTRGRSLVVQDILCAMGAPLIVGPRVLGFLYVDDRGDGERFQEKDLDFLGALAHFTAAAVENAERYQRAATAVEVLYADSPLGELIGDSPAMKRLKVEIQKYAAAPSAHMLIRGESGTGKELVARTLHALSPRATMPLVTLNCAAMPETMVESELFGHVKGAFTGAVSDKRGKFALANGGTLFLDEIGDLSLAAQAKVLRAVQQGEVQPLGSEKTLRVDVRILSATHKDLEAEVAAGRFREDLLYRLNVLELFVPPLRERAEDIPRLAHVFLAQAAVRMGKRVAGFTPQALAALVKHRFPGNVRELQNEAERAAIVVEGGGAEGDAAVIGVGELSSRIRDGGARPAGAAGSPRSLRSRSSLEERYAELDGKEKELVEAALMEAKGNVAEAARLLGISRSIMLGRMKRFELDDGDRD